MMQAFRNAALVLGKSIKLYGADMTGSAPALAYCDYSRHVPSMRDSRYIDTLLTMCREDHIDLIIPTIDTDLLALAENRERFQSIGTKVMISAPEKIRICRDKNHISQFFVDCGLHAPMPVNDWQKYDDQFPAFIKPTDGSGSINAFRAENPNELKLFAKRIKNYIIQPYVEGKEYTIDIFCDWDGNPVSIVPRERVQVRAGEVSVTRIAMDEQMIRESEALCKAFKACGPMTVQFIRDKDGVDWFIEINPRFGGGAPLSMKAGAKSAEGILKLMDGEPVERVTDIADGAVYSRFDQSVCITEGESEVKGFIFDLDDTLYSEKEYIRSGFKAVSDYLGGGYEETLWRYFEEGKPAIDELVSDLNREEDKEMLLFIYRVHQPDIHPYEGVINTMKKLKAQGYRLGIITDGRPEGQRNKLNVLELHDLVEDIIITDELGGAQFRKPCDIAFRIIQNRWRLPASQIAYVGDNPVKDFQGPQQLGMKCFWFENPDGLYASDDILNKEAFTDVSEMWESLVKKG